MSADDFYDRYENARIKFEQLKERLEPELEKYRRMYADGTIDPCDSVPGLRKVLDELSAGRWEFYRVEMEKRKIEGR
jgi:hypothetical protein